MKIIEDIKLDFDDVSIVPKPTELKSRSEVNLDTSYITKHSKQRFNGLPVLVSNMASIGVPNMAKALEPYKIGVCLHKYYTENIKVLLDIICQDYFKYSFITFGIHDRDVKLLEELSKIRIPIPYKLKICLDVANGYMYYFLDKIKYVRELFPDIIIMAGNVCTPEGVENIIKAGADIVKCGIANGSKCDTKNKTGIGYKQFSVALECGKAANELNALCCSDGGIKSPSDISKGLGAGSHMIMCGGLFFGYDENETEWQYIKDEKYMLAYGMASKIANEKYFGGLKDYRTSEGKEELIKNKGSVIELAKDIRGGLASACTYTNTKNLENLHKNCVFTLN